jgi:hypothetical protein
VNPLHIEGLLEKEEGDQGSKPIQKAVRFSDQQNELSKIVAIAITLPKLYNPESTSNTWQKGPYKGLTSAYRAREILLDHFANLKLDITIVQYITTSKEDQDFLAKGLKEINASKVYCLKANPKTVVDINIVYMQNPLGE